MSPQCLFLIEIAERRYGQSFYGRLVEQAENCSLLDAETTLIHDIFILTILEYETQKELLKETESTNKALEIANHMAMGAQNQQKISQILSKNTLSVNIAYNLQNHSRTANYQQQQQVYNRNATVPQNYHYTSI